MVVIEIEYFLGFLLVLALVVLVPLVLYWRRLSSNAEALGSFFGALIGLIGVAVTALFGIVNFQNEEITRQKREEKIVSAAIMGELSAIIEQMGAVDGALGCAERALLAPIPQEHNDICEGNDGSSMETGAGSTEGDSKLAKKKIEIIVDLVNFARHLMARMDTIVFEGHIEKLGVLDAVRATSVASTYAQIRFVAAKKENLKNLNTDEIMLDCESKENKEDGKGSASKKDSEAQKSGLQCEMIGELRERFELIKKVCGGIVSSANETLKELSVSTKEMEAIEDKVAKAKNNMESYQYCK